MLHPPERDRFGPEHSHIIMGEWPAETRCARSVVDRSVDGQVIDERIAQLQYACEEACIGI